VRVGLPQGYPGDIVRLLTEIEQLRVEPDQPARVLSTKRRASSSWLDVRVSTSPIAQGNFDDPHHRDAAGFAAEPFSQGRPK